MEYETYADVIDAYNADNMGYSTLTDYIKGQNIKIKEIEMDPIGDMQKIFENKADGGMIGIEVLFRPKVPAAPSQLVEESEIVLGYRGDAAYRSGSEQSKSIGQGNVGTKSDFGDGPARGGGDNRRDDKPIKILPPFKLPKDGPVVVDTVSEMLTKEKLPTGILEQFYKRNAMLTDPETGKSIKHLTVETPTDYTFRRVTPDGITENDIAQPFGAPQSLSVDPYSNNIIGSDLRAEVGKQDIQASKMKGFKNMDYDTYKTIMDMKGGTKITPFEFEGLKEGTITEPGTFTAADGGRVGFFMGGPALEGQALDIYNSMNAYGFSDQEIADTLSARGLYTPAGSGSETTQSNIIGAQLDQGGGGGITELQKTFRTEPGDPKNFRLSQLEGEADYFPPTTMMGKAKNFLQELSSPKVRGTLGTRLANQKMLPIPLPSIITAQMRSPFNPDSPTYNPMLEGQLNFLEAGTGTRVTGTSDNLKFTEGLSLIGRDPNTGGLKYGPGSVLAGKNVISGFGTNDYEQALKDYISKMNVSQKRKETAFKAQKIIQAEKELKALLDKQKADALAAASYKNIASGDMGGGTPGGGGGNVTTTGGDVYGGSAYGYNEAAEKTDYYRDGGLATMFTRRR